MFAVKRKTVLASLHKPFRCTPKTSPHVLSVIYLELGIGQVVSLSTVDYNTIH